MSARTIDLLLLARANGHKRDVRRLTVYQASVSVIETPRRPSAIRIEVETAGRELSYDECARLLDFAATHVREHDR